MKKILGAALALSLIGSAAFADVTVRGRGYAETNVFHFQSTSTNDEDNTKTSGTSMFSDWDTGDTDIWVDGVFADGKAGGSLNITFDSAAIAFGDWNIWIKPVDFFELRASNEANRWVNRYNSIIDKLESIGCDTAKSVLALSPADIAKRADLEDETVDEVMRILRAEFED